MTYKHNDTDNKYLTLHDCKATEISFENGVLSFFFEEGFWIAPTHPENGTGNTVRTDNSRVDFHLGRETDADVLVYVFTKKAFGKVIREDIPLTKLISDINSKKCTIEFLYQYYDENSEIIKCVLWYKKRPYYRDCQIELYLTGEVYRWNDIRTDEVW